MLECLDQPKGSCAHEVVELEVGRARPCELLCDVIHEAEVLPKDRVSGSRIRVPTPRGAPFDDGRHRQLLLHCSWPEFLRLAPALVIALFVRGYRTQPTFQATRPASDADSAAARRVVGGAQVLGSQRQQRESPARARS